MKKIFTVLFAVMFLLIFTFTYASAGEVPGDLLISPRLMRLEDAADILSDSEEAEITGILDAISEKHQLDVVVVSTQSVGEYTPEEFADDYYDFCGYGYGESHDGLLLLVSMEYRDVHISTCGYAIEAFTDYGLELILGEITPYLSEADYAGGFIRFAELADEYATLARQGTPVDINSPGYRPEFNAGMWLIVSLAIGFIVAFIVTGAMKNSLKSVKYERASKEYIVPGSMDITYARDIFLYNEIFRTEKPQETSSDSGGSSTHTSSSGQTHGGRGGKF